MDITIRLLGSHLFQPALLMGHRGSEASEKESIVWCTKFPGLVEARGYGCYFT